MPERLHFWPVREILAQFSRGILIPVISGWTEVLLSKVYPCSSGYMISGLVSATSSITFTRAAFVRATL